jgi:putative sterol carrier protein
VPEFLSPAWVDELDAAGVTVDPGVTFELEQVVKGTPHGDVRYRFSIAHGRLRVRLAGAEGNPDAAAPDATVTVSFDTAVDLATGRRDGSDVFDAGLVRFEGNLVTLQAATSTLAAVAASLAAVRARTTFPPAHAETAS